MEVEVHPPDQLPASFKRKPPGPKPGTTINKYGLPHKRRGRLPKPVEYKERKPLLRKEKRYNLKRKQEVVLFLLHHRVEDVDCGNRITPRTRSVSESFPLLTKANANTEFVKGMSGCVEKEPRIIDGKERWFRPPTYEETSEFCICNPKDIHPLMTIADRKLTTGKVPKATISTWCGCHLRLDSDK